jgi:NADPH:quinone reductase-like Zn-dependent oxidoreductase
MQAIIHERFGAPTDVLTVQETDAPTPAEGEVLVRVKAAAVAKGDWYVTTGIPYIARPMFGIRTPKMRIAGLEFAGVVESVADGVTDFAAGDEVFGWVDGGALAEFVAAPVTQVAAKPTSISFEQAAAIPMSGLTAFEAIEKAEVAEGMKVLVTGASGGVGSFAVQFAAARGAQVTGVASERNREFVLGLGATDFIDYRTEAITDRGEFDVVIDIAGSPRISDLRRALTDKGTAVLVGGSGGDVTMGYGRTVRAQLVSPFIRQRLTGLMSKPSRVNLEAIAALIDAGSVEPRVGATYPLTQAGEAVELVGTGSSRGKTVVTV